MRNDATRNKPTAERCTFKGTSMIPKTIYLLMTFLLFTSQRGLCEALNTMPNKVPAAINIVLGKDAIEPEQTAARELKHYLEKITDEEYSILKEGEETQPTNNIYVGATTYAQNNGIDYSGMDSEQWIVRTQNNNLILCGGKPRGTIYAVYHYLEDVLGVHWWSPWAEHIPSLKEFNIEKPLDLSGKPAFEFRFMNIGFDTPKRHTIFLAKSRVNGIVGMGTIPAEYGEDIKYAGYKSSHGIGYTIADWHKDGTLKKHPDWIALSDGKRELSSSIIFNHICLSNEEMRKAYLAYLKEYIASCNKKDPSIKLFDVSLADIVSGFCKCESCNAAVKRYGGKDSGLLLEFVNYLADGVKDEFPDVIIQTLAYNNTEFAPTGIKPSSNVRIMLCDTRSSYLEPLDPDGYFISRLKEWAKISDKIYIWDYFTTFKADKGRPIPYEATLQKDILLLQKYNVKGFFIELDYSIWDEMYDLRFWLIAKLLENPNQDMANLIKTFTDGYYGAAGVYIREYIDEEAKAVLAYPSFFTTTSQLSALKFLTPDFILKAQAIFDKAEASVKNSDELLQRVRHARMAIDRVTLELYPKIVIDWREEGKDDKDLPFDKKTIATRIKNTLEKEMNTRIDYDSLSLVQQKRTRTYGMKAKLYSDIEKYLKQSIKILYPPAKFASLSNTQYLAVAPELFIKCNNNAKVVEDKYTQNNMAYRAELSEEAVARLNTFVMKWDMHRHSKENDVHSSTIRILKQDEIIPGKGYHWYKLGTYVLDDDSFLWFFGISTGVDLIDARDPLDPAAKFDIWANIKFEGPAFNSGATDAVTQNAISIEWVVAEKYRGR